MRCAIQITKPEIWEELKKYPELKTKERKELDFKIRTKIKKVFPTLVKLEVSHFLSMREQKKINEEIWMYREGI